jgi:polyhydroxyalkanoate synthesis repressor PhaR
MRIVRRYSNRKLYDTGGRRYVRLDEIARLVREGESVKVVDAATRRDVTARVLSRVLADRSASLPADFFARALRPGGAEASLLRTVRRLEGRIAVLERELARLRRVSP